MQIQILDYFVPRSYQPSWFEIKWLLAEDQREGDDALRCLNTGTGRTV